MEKLSFSERFKKFSKKIIALGFKQLTSEAVTQSFLKDFLDQDMPPEYIKRPRKQGRQILFGFFFQKREVLVLTTYVEATENKKQSYQGWVIIKEISGKKVLFSFPVLDTPMFFDILFGYAKAFQELIEHWPQCPQCNAELTLEHIKGIMHMKRFECHDKTIKHRQKRPEILLTDFPFSVENLKFMKSKFLASYQRQIREWKAGKIVLPKRVVRAEKRAIALTLLREKE